MRVVVALVVDCADAVDVFVVVGDVAANVVDDGGNGVVAVVFDVVACVVVNVCVIFDVAMDGAVVDDVDFFVVCCYCC